MGFQHSRHARLGVHDDLRSLAASLFIDVFIGLGIHPQRKFPHEVQHVRIRSMDGLKGAVGNEATERLLKYDYEGEVRVLWVLVIEKNLRIFQAEHTAKANIFACARYPITVDF